MAGSVGGCEMDRIICQVMATVLQCVLPPLLVAVESGSDISGDVKMRRNAFLCAECPYVDITFCWLQMEDCV